MNCPSPIQQLRADRKLVVDTDDEICGYWHGYLIWIQRDVRCDNDWYIRVNHPDGSYLYDGWWTDSASKSAADAIEEAFRGAELLESDK